MRKTQQDWLHEYGLSHRNPTNRLIHKICVPVIFFTILSALCLLPYGELLLLPALGWYFFLDWRSGILMTVLCLLSVVLFLALSLVLDPRWPLIVLFSLAWIGQFYGHHKEGARPSFLKDLQFLLIGPLWVLLGKD